MNSLKVAAIERDVVIAEGTQAAEFLQGQLSQDIDLVGVGESAWSLLLHPGGKVVALLRVTKAADQRFLIDVDPGWGTAVVARLERFKLRTDCTLSLERWPGLAWRGPSAESIEHDAPIVADAAWDGVAGTDVVGPGVVGDPTIDTETFDAIRIAARWPRMGSELDDSTIPAAAGIIDETVSFTKGCYTGQELVARINSRSNRTPMRLVRAQAGDADFRFTVGSVLSKDGQAVGTITSASAVDAAALGYLKRAVEIPTDVVVDGGRDSSKTTSVALLP